MELTIEMEPHGQMRARAVVCGRFASVYKHEKQKSREKELCFLLSQHRPTAPLSGALELRMAAFLPIPASFSKKKRQEALAGELRPTKTPDLDNLVKEFKDCLTQCKFWADDRQVVDLLAAKYYGDPARWEVQILPARSRVYRLFWRMLR